METGYLDYDAEDIVRDVRDLILSKLMGEEDDDKVT